MKAREKSKKRRSCPRWGRGVRAALTLWLFGIAAMTSVLHGGPTASADDDLSFAAVQIDPALTEQLERRGNLTLRDTSLTDALLTISESWQVNIVVNSDVNGQVNGVFRDTSLREILAAILETNGYTYRPLGRSLVVHSISDDDSISPFFQTATIPMGIASPEELSEGAQLLASPRGRVQAVPSANSLLVFDTPERVEVIRQFASQMDRSARQAASQAATGVSALETVDFAPQYVDAKSLQPVIQSLISPEGKIGLMELENRLVVLDYASRLDLIRETVKRLDTPRPQVRITALIYDLSLEDMERLGINWSTASKWSQDADKNPDGMLSIDSMLQVPAAVGEPTSAMTFMNLSKHIDITGVVSALKQLSNARLLADPSVTVIDREKATIQIVTEIPFQQLTQTGNGGNIGTTAFREAGVTLNVSPKIANDGTLQLEVTPTFSRLTGFTQGINPAPIIDKREASTTVRVVDGQTLVIGGLRQRSDTRERRGVPYLKDRKHIGHLFRARNDSVRESELVVFITSEIVMLGDTHTRLREHAAESRVRGELERIPVAPEMVWPNVYGVDDCDGEIGQGHLIHSHGNSQSMPAPTREQPSEGLVVPELGSAPPPEPVSALVAPHCTNARADAAVMRRLPSINGNHSRYVQRTQPGTHSPPRVSPPASEEAPSSRVRGLLKSIFR